MVDAISGHRDPVPFGLQALDDLGLAALSRGLPKSPADGSVRRNPTVVRMKFLSV
jgi:hypothetical protein